MQNPILRGRDLSRNGGRFSNIEAHARKQHRRRGNAWKRLVPPRNEERVPEEVSKEEAETENVMNEWWGLFFYQHTASRWERGGVTFLHSAVLIFEIT
jgi:hypothetical protein